MKYSKESYTIKLTGIFDNLLFNRIVYPKNLNNDNNRKKINNNNYNNNEVFKSIIL